MVRAADGLCPLDAAAVWILGALQRLLRRGRPARRNSWEWVEVFEDLKEQMLVLRGDQESPANLCPLVPVRMPVEVDVWPEPGEALPLEYEDRQLGAVDNRRLVGKVVQVVVDHIALQQQAAIRFRVEAERDDSAEARQKADQYAMEVRERGRRALRGVDLEELARAVQVEVQGRRAEPPPVESKPLDRTAPPSLEIEFVNERKAIVTEGSTVVRINGSTQVRVFKAVVEAGGRSVAWSDLVHSDMEAARTEMDRRWDELRDRRQWDGDAEGKGDAWDYPKTPRHATGVKTLQRTGSRIRKALGKLSYYWQQDGHGVWWTGGGV